jgi:mersacidin/lichenicidin family type 2 lantibiotic
MDKKVDIARALKDRNYFNSLSDADKATVRKASPVGESDLHDKDLDSVSGGLGGGENVESTTTTTNLTSCLCPTQPGGKDQLASADCTCAC